MTWSFQREFVKEFVKPSTRFIIAGCTCNPNLDLHLAEFANDNHLSYLSWDYQRAGRLFLINTHPDITKTEKHIVINAGFARSPSQEPLSSADLAGPTYITPDGINYRSIHGNPFILTMDLHKPVFWIYQGLASITQLYFWNDKDTILCSDTMRLMTAFVDPLEMDPDAIPMHLMYRTAPGPMTYIKDVTQLQSGQMASFIEGNWRIDQVKQIDDLIPRKQINTSARHHRGV